VSAEAERSNLLVLISGELPRFFEFDGKAIPTGYALTRRAFSRVDEGWMLVPAPKMREGIRPCALVVAIERRESTAQILHDIWQKGRRGKGSHERSPRYVAQ
jgi:hypothetical protein